MAADLPAYFMESVVRGHRILKQVWSPVGGEVLTVDREQRNVEDRYAVAIVVQVINPRRACAERVTVVVSCVCMYVCLSAHAILVVHAIRSITKDAIVLSVRFAAILKWHFSKKLSIRKLERLTYLGRGGHL